MAVDPAPNRSSILLLVVLAVTGYAAWQVVPLSRRMDALDRDRLQTADRLQREIEKLRDELARARLMAATSSAASAPPSTALPPSSAAPTREPTSKSGAAVSPPPAAAPTVPAPPRFSRTDAETFFGSRLLPEDAVIASLLVDGIPPREIARRLRHSNAYIVAKGIQIEKQLSGLRDTPPEVMAELRAAVDRAKASR